MALLKNQLLRLCTSLRVHIKTIHEHHKDFKCEYYGNLRIYMKKMIKKFKCDTCGKSFSHSHQLRVHMKTIHEYKKDFTCDSCQKLFCHSHHLRENNHEDQKDFKCDTCAKSFSVSHHLRVHIKTIFECQKDFKCDSFLNSKY